jgi:hypothetical protein
VDLHHLLLAGLPAHSVFDQRTKALRASLWCAEPMQERGARGRAR